MRFPAGQGVGCHIRTQTRVSYVEVAPSSLDPWRETLCTTVDRFRVLSQLHDEEDTILSRLGRSLVQRSARVSVLRFDLLDPFYGL